MKFSKSISSEKYPGMPPGSIVFVGERKVDKPIISVVNYSADTFIAKQINIFQDAISLINKKTVTWINIIGIHDTDLIEGIGTALNINHLMLEDILNTQQHPKIEFSDDMIFTSLKLIYNDETSQEIHVEHISMVLSPNYVLVFQESLPDNFSVIKDRIANNKGRITKFGTDYLFYAILDLIVDNYFLVLDKFNDKIELIEETLITETNPQTLTNIHNLKRHLIFLERNLKPVREIVRKIETEESELIKKSTLVFIRDVFDHIVQVTDNMEAYKETLTVMIDIYISSQGNKLNEVMKVLTIIATIFIPLTFIVGVYGMNFEMMPELKWQFGYLSVWILMLAIGIGMVLYFKKKKWF